MQRGRPFRLDAVALAKGHSSGILALDERVLGGLVALQMSAPPPPAPNAQGVAVLSIEGPLEQRAEDHWCGYCEGYDAIADRFGAACADPRVGAIVLRVDSPGGDVQGLEEGVRRMVEAREASGKPVFAFADEQIASAAYWIASVVATAGVYLPAAAEVGSIGVIGATVDQTKALELAGFSVTLVRDPAGKAESNSMGPVPELVVERLTGTVVHFAGRFIEAVAGARGMSAAAVRQLNGATLRGEAAVTGGLADGVSSLEGVIGMAAEAVEKKRNDMRVKLMLGLSETATAAEVDAALEKMSAEATLGRDVLATTGAKDADAARGVVGAWKDSHAALAKERVDQAEQRAAAEGKERVELVAQLVTAGHEKPATAWADPVAAADPAKRVPAEPWASMSMGALRARVATLAAIPGAAGSEETKVTTAEGLSEIELQYCKKHKVSPEAFAKKKAEVHAARARAAGKVS